MVLEVILKKCVKQEKVYAKPNTNVMKDDLLIEIKL
jgi:hypothetical protein